ncbi:MAG: hypothetical protein HC819_06555 [Cyclobacteriaceae bacterium]|nr:hypothetical protein [Cyclobacteriaceae bacterium]
MQLFCAVAMAQEIGHYLGGEKFMYAETKQINQFFRRFNSEENLDGKRIYEGDPNFHHKEHRTSYIRMLFDNQNNDITESVKNEFIADVTNDDNAKFLDFYGGRWFAEVDTKFKFNGQTRTAVLFLELEKENLGIKWVINNVYFYPFTKLFYADSTAATKFLHPMSHELDFMNLIKVFKEPNTVEYYFDEGFKPDFRTLFLYEIKKGDLIFENVEKVSFHFFQLDNWYFQLREFNRQGNNSGWLISNISKIPEDQKEALLKYIHYEK